MWNFFKYILFFKEIRWATFMGTHWGKKTGISTLEILTNQKFFENLKSAFWFILTWFNSCNNTLFTRMTLTLHKSQLHCSCVMQRWACSSLMSTFSSADSRCETLFYCCSLLRNNIMATNLQRFTSCYDN